MYQLRSRTMSASTTTRARRRGRPPAASREDVVVVALNTYLHGERIDVQAVAVELGLGRTTIYRWFGSREGLVAEVVVRAAEPLFAEARANARGRGGPALLDTFDRINRGLAEAPALRRFLENERDALRILTSSSGNVHSRMVEKVRSYIHAARRAGDPCVRDRAPGGVLSLQRCDDDGSRRRRPSTRNRGRASGNPARVGGISRPTGRCRRRAPRPRRARPRAPRSRTPRSWDR